MIDIAVALTHLRPGEVWTLTGNSFDGLQWGDTTEKPSLASLKNAWVAIESEREQALNDALAAKESALKKLAGWGLTPDEIAAIITP